MVNGDLGLRKIILFSTKSDYKSYKKNLNGLLDKEIKLLKSKH